MLFKHLENVFTQMIFREYLKTTRWNYQSVYKKNDTTISRSSKKSLGDIKMSLSVSTSTVVHVGNYHVVLCSCTCTITVFNIKLDTEKTELLILLCVLESC